MMFRCSSGSGPRISGAAPEDKIPAIDAKPKIMYANFLITQSTVVKLFLFVIMQIFAYLRSAEPSCLVG